MEQARGISLADRRVVRVLVSPWWYWVALGYLAVSWLRPALVERSSPLSRVCEVVVLLVCVLRFLVPAARLPGSTLARGWATLAVQWLALAVFRGAGYSMSGVSGWSSALLALAVFAPSLVFLAASFAVLPFAYRQRGSVVLDWLAVSAGLTIAITVVLRLVAPATTLLDGLFIGGDLSTLYALVLIRRQQPARWSQLFSALSLGIAAIALADAIWVLARSQPSIIGNTGAVYAVAWLVFSRAALVLPAASPAPDLRRLQVEAPLYHLLPYVLLVAGVIMALALDETAVAGVLLALLLVRIGVEISESQALGRRLDSARAEAEALRELIRSSLHDLRSPLDGAVGVLAILEDQPESPHRARLLTLLHAQIDDISDQMIDLLDAARAAGPPSIQIQPIDLAPIVQAEIERARRIAGYRGQELTIEASLPDEPLRALGSARQIGRVLANLLKNAVEHGGPHVTVGLERDADTVRLIVSDDGPGYPAALVAGAWAAGWSTRADGFGLGLVGVAANLALLNGRLELANGSGARATVALPRAA